MGASGQLIGELIANDPETALSIAVPRIYWEQLPPSVLGHLEERVSGMGEMIVTVGCSPEEGIADRTTEVIVDGRRYCASLVGRRRTPGTMTGLSVHGIAIGDRLALHPSPVRLLDPTGARMEPVAFELLGERHVVRSLEDLATLEQRLLLQEATALGAVVYTSLEAESEGDTSETLLPPRLSGATGALSVLVIRTRFDGASGTSINETIAANVMAEVDQYYADWSRGRLGITSVITQVYGLPETGPSYALDGNGVGRDRLHLHARQAASAHHNLASYDRIIVYFSSLRIVYDPEAETFVYPPDFDRQGYGTLRGRNVWLNGSMTPGLVAHELGHTFGLEHAQAWNAGNSVVGPGWGVDYGDLFDIMGGRPLDDRDHPNPFYSYALQWLDRPEVQTVSTSGRFRVYRLDHAQSSGVQALVLARDSVRTYWIGLRQRFTDRPDLMLGAYIIWGGPTTRDTYSQLLDMSPTNSVAAGAGLPLGSTFEDVEFGISMTVVDYGGTAPNEYIDVDINLDGYAPEITSPPADTTAYIGDPLVLSVMVQGSRPLVYNWFKDGEPLPGQITNTLDLGPLGMEDSGSYVVSVSNAAGDAESGPAELTVVHRPPSLTWRSRYQNTLRKGAGLTLGVGINSSASIQISWFHDDVEIPDADQKELTVETDGLFTCVVDNGYGSVQAPFRVSVVGNCSVVGWGSNVFGEGEARTDLEGLTAIDAVNSYSVALRSDGRVTAWGNGRPESGLGALNDIIAISAGSPVNLALRNDGKVLKWNLFAAPVEIPEIQWATVVAVGTNGTALALDRDGAIDIISIVDWTMAPPATPGFVIDVAIGHSHAVALLNDLTVVTWGSGVASQADVSGLKDVVSIAAGGFHAVALHKDGTLSAWGENTDGQSFISTEHGRPADARMLQIGAGFRHTLTVRNRYYRPPWVDDTLPLELAIGVEAWGQNAHGQATVPSRLPLPFAVAGGLDHSLALVERAKPPVIDSGPESLVVAEGESATFQVFVSSDLDPTYQWFRDSDELVGATLNYYQIVNVNRAEGGTYRIVVTTPAGSDSASATLTVQPA